MPSRSSSEHSRQPLSSYYFNTVSLCSLLAFLPSVVKNWRLFVISELLLYHLQLNFLSSTWRILSLLSSTIFEMPDIYCNVTERWARYKPCLPSQPNLCWMVLKRSSVLGIKRSKFPCSFWVMPCLLSQFQSTYGFALDMSIHLFAFFITMSNILP